jgi:hypothetical protein
VVSLYFLKANSYTGENTIYPPPRFHVYSTTDYTAAAVLDAAWLIREFNALSSNGKLDLSQAEARI